MTRRREAIGFIFLAILSTIVAVVFVLRSAVPQSHTHSDVWPVFAACKVDNHYVKMNYSIAYTPAAKALDGKKIRLDGFMLPLESGEKSNHFLLSVRSPTCPYCPPGAPNEIVEVFTQKPIGWSEQLTTVEGILQLMPPQSDTGVFFRLHDSETVDTGASAATPAPYAATRPIVDYRFYPLDKNGAHPDAAVTLDRWRGKPLLVLFWRSDCAPCLQELRRLPELAQQHPHLTIALISLEDVGLAAKHLPALPANVTSLIARDEVREIVTAFGNDKRIALPYSVMLDARGGICAKHSGIVATDDLNPWQQQCSTPN